MTATIDTTIQEQINNMKQKRTGIIEHKGFEIIFYDDNWPNSYHVSVKDKSSDKYIYESNIWCKSDVMLYKNIEMILEYLG